MPVPNLSHALALSSGASLLRFLAATLRSLFPRGISPVMRARSANRIETKARHLVDTDPETALAMLRITRDTQEAPTYQDSLIPQDRTADVPANSPP